MTIDGTTPPTGELQFGNDRPGVFLRNDACIVLKADLRTLLLYANDAPICRRRKIEEFMELLESVR